MRADFDAAAALVGRPVRAVLEGDAPGVRVENGRRVRVPYRAVITGECVGWRTDVGVVVEIAGYGTVPLTAVRHRRWWQR